MKKVIEQKQQKEKRVIYAKFLFAAATVVAIIGVVALSSAIYQFCYYIKEYTSQGYSAALVVKSLLMTQLVPGVADSLALYGGIALILFTLRKIYIKVFGIDIKKVNKEIGGTIDNININNDETSLTEEIKQEN